MAAASRARLTRRPATRKRSCLSRISGLAFEVGLQRPRPNHLTAQVTAALTATPQHNERWSADGSAQSSRSPHGSGRAPDPLPGCRDQKVRSSNLPGCASSSRGQGRFRHPRNAARAVLDSLVIVPLSVPWW